MGLDDEAERLSTILGNKRMVMMGNHGFMTVAESLALAFDLAYYFERACRTYLTAKASGLELSVLSNDIAEKTAKQWEVQDQTVCQHLIAIRRILDEEEPDYRL
jgi:ribulose-5-phosphate 4-epimerase/fuculose-1-phosphate aldolase